jgi:hypothetical protein
MKVLPGMRLAGRAPQSLWPPDARRLAFPVLEMACRLTVEGNTVAVITRDTVDGDRVRYRRMRYRWDGEGILPAEAETSQPLASHLHPCRLNADGVLDLAGGRWVSSETAMLPLPVYETWASLDGGNTFHVRRSASLPGLRPRCSFVDFDGDGVLDMVTEETGFFDGGVRETLSRVLTLSEIRHTVSVFRQEALGFSKKPTLRAAFSIELESPAISQGPMFQRYRAGELVDVTGDFDGDGTHDVIVRDCMDRLVVHLSGRDASHAELPIPRAAAFAVADVNADGRSDIVVKDEDKPGMVYFSREEGP